MHVKEATNHDNRELTVAIIVSYLPNLHEMGALFDVLMSQVSYIVVVDNGSDTDIADWIAARNDHRLYCLSLGNNYGVAAAQNAGIDWARTKGAEYVLLFDQDSEPAPDMVERLIEAANGMTTQGHAVAAVGPRYTDGRQENPPPFIRVRGLNLERCTCTTSDAVVPVDYLISSGCLIPMSTLDVVGDMAKGLFIDYVDIEWGLRAKHLGFQSFGVFNATMSHQLGEHPITFLGRKIPLHTPLRHYYHFRNAVWLYRQSWPPLNWKLVDAWRLLLKYGFYTLFAPCRLSHLKMMTLGLCHGLMGRMGRFEDV